MPRKKRDNPRASPGAHATFASLRRQPLQRRGTQRVLAVLDACDELLTRMPFDQITISEIARTSRVPIGTIYFFFEDRTTIFLCHIERVTLKIREELNLGRKEIAATLPQYFNGLEKRLEKIWIEHRSMMDMFYTYRRHPIVAPIIEEASEFGVTQIAKKLMAEFPRLPPEQATTAARVVYGAIARALDMLVYMPPSEANSFRAMWRQMIIEFVRSLGREPTPTE